MSQTTSYVTPNNYLQAMQTKADKWKEALERLEIKRLYKDGIKTAFGIEPSDTVVDRYANRVKSDTAAQKYKSKVTSADTAKKWFIKTLVGLTGKSEKDIRSQFGIS